MMPFPAYDPVEHSIALRNAFCAVLIISALVGVLIGVFSA
jgi:hypothetical protein